MTQFCDKMIDVFMNDKTQTKELRKLLIFREEWKKYRDKFYHRCQDRLDGEGDPVTKQKLIKLKTRIKKVKSFPTAAPVFICYLHKTLCYRNYTYCQASYQIGVCLHPLFNYRTYTIALHSIEDTFFKKTTSEACYRC